MRACDSFQSDEEKNATNDDQCSTALVPTEHVDEVEYNHTIKYESKSAAVNCIFLGNLPRGRRFTWSRRGIASCPHQFLRRLLCRRRRVVNGDLVRGLRRSFRLLRALARLRRVEHTFSDASEARAKRRSAANAPRPNSTHRTPTLVVPNWPLD